MNREEVQTPSSPSWPDEASPSVSVEGRSGMEVGLPGCRTDGWLVKRALRYYFKSFSPPPSEVSGTGSRRLFQRMGNLEAGITAHLKKVKPELQLSSDVWTRNIYKPLSIFKEQMLIHIILHFVLVTFSIPLKIAGRLDTFYILPYCLKVQYIFCISMFHLYDAYIIYLLYKFP